MQEKHPTLASADIYGFRVIVKDVPHCYLTLGALHGLYKPIPGSSRTTSRVMIPKANGYQSVHTTLFGPYGTPVAECRYVPRKCTRLLRRVWLRTGSIKSGTVSINEVQQKTHQWLKSLLEIQSQSGDSVEFQHIKVDLFPDEVYVFTPKGKIPSRCRRALPQSILPMRCIPISAIVALPPRSITSLMPLRTMLRNGDRSKSSPPAPPNPIRPGSILFCYRQGAFTFAIT